MLDIDEQKEKALNVALNKISGDWDMPLLTALLKDLDESGFDATLTFIDNSDPIQVVITSTGGDVFKNGQGSTVLTAVCYQAGVEIDADGKGTYTWTKYNKDGAIDTSFGTSGSKTGKTLSVSNTDVDTKATFMCVVTL